MSRTTFSDIALESGGVNARVWFRPLASDWGSWLAPFYFHTWIEIVDPRNEPPVPDKPIAFGVYDDDGPAVEKAQLWEHSNDAIEKYGSYGDYERDYVRVSLNSMDAGELDRILDMIYDDVRHDAGTYRFRAAFIKDAEQKQITNCMTYMERYVETWGGPSEMNGKIRRIWEDRAFRKAFGSRPRVF